MFCKNCGEQITDGALFCTNCGASVAEPPVICSTTCCARLSTACISAARIPTTGISTACFQFRQRYGHSRSCYGNSKLLPVLDSVCKYGMSFDVYCRNHPFRNFHEKGKSRRRVVRHCRCGSCCFHCRSCSFVFVFLHLQRGDRNALFDTLLVLG